MSTSLRYALALAGAAALGCGPAVLSDDTDGGPSTTTGTPSPDTSAATSAGTASSEPPGSTTSGGPDGTSSGGPLDSSSEASTDSGHGFLGPTDTDADTIACDSYLQDCPDGEKCNPYADDGGSAWNALACFPVVPSPDQAGEPCQVVGGGASGFDSCDVGSMCWGVDSETSAGTCVAMCEGTSNAPTCANPDTSCSIANDGALNLCLRSCDPDGNDCPEGETCYPIDNAFVCAPDATGRYPGAPGTSCDGIASCNLGAVCVVAAAHGPGCDGMGCCTETCDLTDPMCENPNQQCQQWFEDGMAPPGFEDVGACMVPQ